MRSESSQVDLPDSGSEGRQSRSYRYQTSRNREPRRYAVFTGEGVQVDKPRGAPEWMPDKIWKPKVKKVGMENLESTKLPVEKVVVVKRSQEMTGAI